MAVQSVLRADTRVIDAGIKAGPCPVVPNYCATETIGFGLAVARVDLTDPRKARIVNSIEDCTSGFIGIVVFKPSVSGAIQSTDSLAAVRDGTIHAVFEGTDPSSNSDRVYIRYAGTGTKGSLTTTSTAGETCLAPHISFDGVSQTMPDGTKTIRVVVKSPDVNGVISSTSFMTGSLYSPVITKDIVFLTSNATKTPAFTITPADLKAEFGATFDALDCSLQIDASISSLNSGAESYCGKVKGFLGVYVNGTLSVIGSAISPSEEAAEPPTGWGDPTIEAGSGGTANKILVTVTGKAATSIQHHVRISIMVVPVPPS
jgi:hypothetical protein